MNTVEFALIGHPESWDAAALVVASLRGPGLPPVPLAELREILPWIPPRTICRVTVRSTLGIEANGVGIDCFIPPDRLDARFVQENLERVLGATDCAVRLGARVASLGGFSSILLEGKVDFLPRQRATAFTTGNALTVAYIVRGIERAMALAGRDLGDARLLIVGASGDIGSGCARYFAPRVARLALCARNADRLARLATQLSRSAADIAHGTDVTRLAEGCDLAVCVASMPQPSLVFDRLARGAIVCDAGYPKNVLPGCGPRDGVVFYGGLGEASAGLRVEPDLWRAMHPGWPANVAHGCLLEGMALALERRFEPFSQGRGGITADRVEEIWNIAQRHGLALAPLFNGDGAVESQIAALKQEVIA